MNQKKQIKKFRLITLLLMFIINTFGTISLTYSLFLLNGIETHIRILVMVIIILLNITFSISYFKSFKKNKKKFYIFLPLLLIYSSILIFSSILINEAYSKINNLSNTKTLYSSSLVTNSSNKIDNIKKIEGTIGIVSDKENIVGYQIPKEILKEEKLNNELLEYNNYLELLLALVNEEVDYAFLPTNYQIMFSSIENDTLGDLNEKTKIIYTKEKSLKQKDTSNKDIKEPFTVLLMGVDSEVEGIKNSSFNGDSLMLVTFNPITLSSTILSIPRDSYVPITCFKNSASSKITHAAWYGEQCMIDTIENYTDINIDYFVKVNFKAVVELVDALGGVEIDVPYNFCEQNSNREFGENTIYVEKGLQTLNGEEALAYSRNRHPNTKYCSSKWTNYYSDDIVRGKHQQEVVKAILNKLKTINNLNTVNNLLSTISNNMETNMTTNQILSLYNVGKDLIAKSSSDVSDIISLKKLGLSYKAASVYDVTLKQIISDIIIYEDSLKEVSDAMKVNLGLLKQTEIKTFSFDASEPYVQKTIGLSGIYSKLPNYKAVPNFVGDSIYQSRITANNLGLKVIYKNVTSGSGQINTVIDQNYKPGTTYDSATSIILTVLVEEKKEETNEESKEDKTEEEKEETTTEEDLETEV